MPGWFPKLTGKRVAALLVVGIVAFAAVFSAAKRPHLDADRMVAFVDAARLNDWSPVWFTALYIVSCVICPFILFPIAGGILFGFWEGLFYNMVASNIGAFLAFLIARTVGHEAVQRRLGARLKPFEQAVHDHSIIAMIVIRIIGFPPFMVANYLAGLSSMRPRAFIIGSFLGMTFWTTLLTAVSGTLWKIFLEAGEAGLKQAIARFFPAVAGIAVTLVAVLIFVRSLRKKALPPLDRTPE